MGEITETVNRVKHVTELSDDELVELWKEEGQLLDGMDEKVITDVEIEYESDWDDDGKYQDKEVIVKDKDGKFYRFGIIRSGSYFSFYDFQGQGNATEVKKITETKVIERWVSVNE